MEVNFQKSDGLVPAIIQDFESGHVLMLGYMNAEALERTRTDGEVTFYSRSKGRLWKKGESSGNFLEVVAIKNDCDDDALLILVKPRGPTCHTGLRSCFGDEQGPRLSFLTELAGVIAGRRRQPSEASYVSSLFAQGKSQIARKVGEEAVELIVEALDGSDARFVSEAADLLFHFLVLLEGQGVSLGQVLSELKTRSGSRRVESPRV